MLVLAKKLDYDAYNPVTCIHHFLNGITDPLINKANLLLDANCNQYSGSFDSAVEYLINQVSHQEVNQQLNISSIGNSVPKILKIKDGN